MARSEDFSHSTTSMKIVKDVEQQLLASNSHRRIKSTDNANVSKIPAVDKTGELSKVVQNLNKEMIII